MPPSPFRYFRDPHHFSSYNEAGEQFPFCGLVRPGYSGGFYGMDMDGYDFICEICLLEGRLTEKNFTTNEGESLQPEIRLRHLELSETEVEALVQARTTNLEQHTPKVETWQGILWPAHCGDFCCFLNEAGQLDMQRLAPDGDGRRFFEDHMTERQEDVWEDIRPDAPVDNSAAYSVGVYLFQCLECGEHVIQWDCD